jgi:EpsI family protein
VAPAIRVRLLLLLALALALGLGPALAARRAQPAGPAALEAIPLSLGDITGVEDRLDDEIADMLQASQTLARSYRLDGHPYWLFLGYFAQQRFGSQIHSPRHCYPGSGWNILRESRDDRLGGPSGALVIQREKERRVVLYQYRTHGGATTSELRLKAELVVGSLLGRPLDAAFLRYSTPLEPDEEPEDALVRLTAFARSLEPELREALPF